jgi:hypothetical protein
VLSYLHCLPVVFNRSETSPVTTREEQRLRVCENRILSKIFGPTRDEVTGYWITIHKKDNNI